LTNVRYLGIEKSSNKEETIHNSQIDTSDRLEQKERALHRPENGEMIQSLITDRNEADFGDDTRKSSIQQESKSTQASLLSQWDHLK
jgi:hypothetical protein